jgi:hypothetical protein
LVDSSAEVERGHSQADRHRHRPVVGAPESVRLRQCAPLLGQHSGLAPPRRGQQHEELLAAVANDLVIGPHVDHDQRREPAQGVVADLVVVDVVDRLEVVEVGEHDRERLAVAPRET